MTTELEDVVKQAEKLDPDTRKAFVEHMQRLLDTATTLDAEQWQFLTAMMRLLPESPLFQPRWEHLLSDPRQLDTFYRTTQAAIEESGRNLDYTSGYLHGMGMDNELVAHILAAPPEKQGRELRLALIALVEERSGHDPVKAPRHLTFEQFFNELGMTDDQIADAQQQGA